MLGLRTACGGPARFDSTMPTERVLDLIWANIDEHYERPDYRVLRVRFDEEKHWWSAWFDLIENPSPGTHFRATLFENGEVYTEGGH